MHQRFLEQSATASSALRPGTRLAFASGLAASPPQETGRILPPTHGPAFDLDQRVLWFRVKAAYPSRKESKKPPSAHCCFLAAFFPSKHTRSAKVGGSFRGVPMYIKTKNMLQYSKPLMRLLHSFVRML